MRPSDIAYITERAVDIVEFQTRQGHRGLLWRLIDEYPEHVRALLARHDSYAAETESLTARTRRKHRLLQ